MSKMLSLLRTTPRLKATTLTPFSPSSYSLVSFSRSRLSRPYPLQIQCKALSFLCPTIRLPFFSLVVAGRREAGFAARAFDDWRSAMKEETTLVEDKDEEKKGREEYPSGEFEFREFGTLRKFGVKVKMLVAFPWERVKKGSVFTMKLPGQISELLKSSFSSGLSLPQICENLIEAVYDPSVSGVYLHIDSLNCGWGNVKEIRRHILNFKKSGKFIVGYLPTYIEKEYDIASACEELYAPPSAYFSLYGLTIQTSFLRGYFGEAIQPQYKRIGKYKSSGDQLACRTMSEENCEMLTTILDTIYGT